MNPKTGDIWIKPSTMQRRTVTGRTATKVEFEQLEAHGGAESFRRAVPLGMWKNWSALALREEEGAGGQGTLDPKLPPKEEVEPEAVAEACPVSRAELAYIVAALLLPSSVTRLGTLGIIEANLSAGRDARS